MTDAKSPAYSTKKLSFQLMLTRPNEPVFMPKGNDETAIVFNVPDRYLRSRFRPIKKELWAKFHKKGVKSIPIKNVTIPDLSEPLKLKRNSAFSLFYDNHINMAAKLIDIFMEQRSTSDLLSVAAYCHDRINPYLFNYALSVAVLHRTDTRDVVLPSLVQSFPAKFVDSAVFVKARQEAAVVPVPVRAAIEIPMEYTANSKEPEQRVAFFREDIGINLHHWHWHLVYPTRSQNPSIVNKDRRGELFYYMHQQVLARYNAERFAHDLQRVKPLNLRESVPEGYFPKLESMVASRSWPPRFRDITLKDLNDPENQIQVSIAELEASFKNIMDAVKAGVVKNAQGKEISIKGIDGIDILGNMVEASMLSPNRQLYGNLHNLGHVLIALTHDYDGRFLESMSVMGDTSTAMRDPIFYRWHVFINDIFVAHKDTLPSYTQDDLEYSDVKINDIAISIAGKSGTVFQTFWKQTELDLSRGLDFSARGPVKIRFTHLQQDDFDYVVKVKNSSSKQLVGMMRIFMAPRLNEKGVAMDYEEQRKLMIELDRFRVTLRVGDNVIKRNAKDSSVTIPYERTFRDLGSESPTDPELLRAFNFCGCGWPQHMLIPKGKPDEGMVFDLFVMISDYEQDKIDQDIAGQCNDAESFCGIQDKLYPDKRSMGYPFDRVGRPGTAKLDDFLTPNMKVQEVKVVFTPRIAPPPAPEPFPDFNVVAPQPTQK